MTIRKKYAKEFKLDAVSLVTEQGYSRSEAATSLGIRVGLLSRWIREHQADDSHAFRGNGKLTPDQLELRRLKVENRQLRMEREILKKATAFFAKESK